MPGTWRALATPPSTPVERMLLLTDGSVFCHHGSKKWSLLIPDEQGHYLNSRWIPVEDMYHDRVVFAACVLADGRVLVALGSPFHGSHIDDMTIEIFNPVAAAGSRWTLLAANPGWFADGTAIHLCPLADGRRILIGADSNIIENGSYITKRQNSLYDITTNTWRLVELVHTVESGQSAWTLMREGSVLSTSGCPTNFRYIPDAGLGRWVTVPKRIFFSRETLGVLLPDGRVWVANLLPSVYADTYFYQPPAAPSDEGLWITGPRFPLERESAPDMRMFAACVLPSGKVLCSVNRVFTEAPVFLELDAFDGAGTLTQIEQPPLPENSNSANWASLFMLLPTGEVLVSALGQMYIYTPNADSRPPQEAWRPHLTAPNGHLSAGTAYTATGTLFNGMTQAVFHNFKYASATNFPIIRLAHAGTVRYLRTYGHTGTGIATGTAVQNTHFTIPEDFPTGTADLSVIANGIESNRIRITIDPIVRPPDPGHEILKLIGSLADGPLYVLGPDGIRPVPPFGPDGGPFKKQLRESVLKAYEHIFTGLVMIGSQKSLKPEIKQDIASHNNNVDQLARKQIDYGLTMLRQLGDQIDAETKSKKDFHEARGKAES